MTYVARLAQGQQPCLILEQFYWCTCSLTSSSSWSCTNASMATKWKKKFIGDAWAGSKDTMNLKLWSGETARTDYYLCCNESAPRLVGMVWWSFGDRWRNVYNLSVYLESPQWNSYKHQSITITLMGCNGNLLEQLRGNYVGLHSRQKQKSFLWKETVFHRVLKWSDLQIITYCISCNNTHDKIFKKKTLLSHFGRFSLYTMKPSSY